MPGTWRNKLAKKKEKNLPKSYSYKNLTITRQPADNRGFVEWMVRVNNRKENFKVISDRNGLLWIDFQSESHYVSATSNALFMIASLLYAENENCKATLKFDGYNKKLADALRCANFEKVASGFNFSKFMFNPFARNR